MLVGLIFSKFFYLASLTSYYTFYLINRFHLPYTDAQLYLFYLPRRRRRRHHHGRAGW